MRLSNLTDYAIVILSAAARGGKSSVSAAELSEETGVPLPTAQKLMGRLVIAGLLKSSRGIGGGFRLARDPSAISIADIIEAVEGPIAMTACVEEGRHDCGLETACKVRPHWGAVNMAVKGALGGVSLASLSTLARAEPVEALPFSFDEKKDSASTGSARAVGV
jgi:FeS assembly SUF system regulator